MKSYQQEIIYLKVKQRIIQEKAPNSALDNAINAALMRIAFYNSVRDFASGYSFEEQQALFEEQVVFDNMLPLLIEKVENAAIEACSA